MTKEQFLLIDNFILENLNNQNPFTTTTTKLLGLIRGEINFKGNNDFYDEFLKYCRELEVEYNVKAFSEFDEDKPFDIQFLI